MRHLILFVAIMLGYHISSPGQGSRFNFMVEYSPNYSKITDAFGHELFKWSHNVFLKTGYPLTSKVKLTGGIGFFSTGEQEISEFGGFMDINKIKFAHNYDYILLPFGIKIDLGSVYINPEIGIGPNVSKRIRQTTYFQDGHKEVKAREEQLFNTEINKITIPFIISSGYEFEVGNVHVLLGLKGYYSITKIWKDVPRDGHSFGLGILSGVVF